MAKLGFYPRLARQNMERNAKYYLPYLASCVVSAAVFYILLYLCTNSGVRQLRGAAYVESMLVLGAIVTALFSAALLFYTNGFLIKRRRKELGLYNILGMEKRHIARFMFWETVYTALIGVIVGIALGILLSKLMLLLLCRILKEGVPFGFEVSPVAVGVTAVVFSVIFFLNLMKNLWHVGRARPIELLHGGNAGEKEPKTRVLLAVSGAVTLAAGYTMALLVKDPVAALGFFFIAVILVIIGTFCLFTAGSIAVLKALRKNKAYYYKTRHFISVSGMLHRMKRNAAGLASVCILSTMVLVTVSTTVCLYVGMGESLDAMYPRSANFILYRAGNEDEAILLDILSRRAELNGTEVSDVVTARYYEKSNSVSDNVYPGDVVRLTSDGTVLNYNGQDYPSNLYFGFNMSSGAPASEMMEDVWRDIVDSRVIVYESMSSSDSDAGRSQVYSSLGGFFFIGLLLGFLFLMATALIIYYKQVSEGYEDAEGYKIMQQVGMDSREVRASIVGQIRAVFLLPIVAAAVHVIFAFNMIVKMLAIFNLTNTGLFALCCLGTLVVFVLVYLLIYALTAKAYYKIVKA